MLTDSRLRIFLTVVESGSFTKTAKLLDISQPAVSQNIAELENTLGIKLFDRSSHSLALTREGQLFKSYAERIQYWYDAADSMFARVLRKSSSRTIRIQASADLCSSVVPDIVSDIQALDPEFLFDVSTLQLSPDGVPSSPANAAVPDLILRTDLSDGRLDLEAPGTLIGHSDAVAVISASSSLSHSRAERLSDLPVSGIACWTGPAPASRLLPLDLLSKVVLSTDSMAVLRRFVEDSNSHVAIVPGHAFSTLLQEGKLCRIHLDTPIYEMTARFIPSESFGRTPVCRLIRERFSRSFQPVQPPLQTVF